MEIRDVLAYGQRAGVGAVAPVSRADAAHVRAHGRTAFSPRVDHAA